MHLGDYRRLRLPAIAGTTLFIGNPPYGRHHGISPEWKAWLRRTSRRRGLDASALAGLHVHFFLATAEHGRPGDYGAFITSSEWLDVNYGKLVRQLLLDGLGGESLHVLDPGALPFVDAAMTGAITCFQMGAAPSSMRVRRVGSVADLGALDKGRAIGRMRPARAAAGHRSGLAGRPEGARSCQNLEWIIPGIVEVLIPRKGEGSCLHPGSTLMSSRTARSG